MPPVGINHAHLVECLAPLKRWAQRMRLKAGANINIGVAVSGGPDSMALAYLLKNVDSDIFGYNLRPTAFIVDHAARSDSEKEAELAASWCERLGIPAIIRRILWKTRSSPLLMRNFETMARESRYQLLCEMARASKIKHVFLGHHRDDELEFLLMRLAQQNPNFSSILGMRDTSSLPPLRHLRYGRGALENEPPVSLEEVLGLQSPSNVGKEDDVDQNMPHPAEGDDFELLNLSSDPSPPKEVSKLHRSLQKYSLNGSIKAFTMGGVRLYRPLLMFDKSTLLKVCRMNDLDYIHDETNDDPTFTQRNAIRLLRQKYKLPRALQEPALLERLSKARSLQAFQKFRVSNFLCYIRILQFDLRSGTVTVEIPNIYSDLVDMDEVAASFVAFQLTSLVSSRLGKSPANWHQASCNAKILCQKFFDNETSSQRFTWREVQFDLMSQQGTTDSPSSWIWRLSRQRATATDQLALRFEVKREIYSKYHSHPRLWDGRYWFELNSNSAHLIRAVSIRRYMQEDAEQVKQQMTKSERSYFDEQLKECAPGELRWTLPVLVIDNKIIAFPTIQTKVLPEAIFAEATRRLDLGNVWLEWSVIYKAIDVDLPLKYWGSSKLPSRDSFLTQWPRTLPAYASSLNTRLDTKSLQTPESGDMWRIRRSASVPSWLEPDMRDIAPQTPNELGREPSFGDNDSSFGRSERRRRWKTEHMQDKIAKWRQQKARRKELRDRSELEQPNS